MSARAANGGNRRRARGSEIVGEDYGSTHDFGEIGG
jgi:hypothetical protein